MLYLYEPSGITVNTIRSNKKLKKGDLIKNSHLGNLFIVTEAEETPQGIDKYTVEVVWVYLLPNNNKSTISGYSTDVIWSNGTYLEVHPTKEYGIVVSPTEICTGKIPCSKCPKRFCCGYAETVFPEVKTNKEIIIYKSFEERKLCGNS